MIAQLERILRATLQNKPAQNPYEQWEQQQPMDKQQQNDPFRMDSNLGYRGLKCILLANFSAVVKHNNCLAGIVLSLLVQFIITRETIIRKTIKSK